MKAILLALVMMAGCTVGDSGPAPTPGSGSSPTGGSPSGGGTGDMADAGTGGGGTAAACTGAVYDPCTDNSQCTSGLCQAFNGAGIEVCTQACTAGDDTTCPTQAGAAAQCNNMGTCKPPAANDCSR